MALQRDARYPGRWTAASTGHPQGAFKNRTAPGALDGSYIEQDWANDWDGFFSSLLNAASITPNGNVDAVGSSQYFSALQLVSKGRLINTRTFTASTTYTPTPGTTYVIIEVVGGGGGGGGCAATGASQAASGSGGASGSYAKGLFLTGFSGLGIVVGAGGNGGVAGINNGSPGGASSVGGLISAPGGAGGIGGAVGTPPGLNLPPAPGTAPTGGNIISSVGNVGGAGFSTSATLVVSGYGAASVFGGSSQGTNGSGVNGGAPGAGGSGAARPQSNAAAAGGNGSIGQVIISEYA